MIRENSHVTTPPTTGNPPTPHGPRAVSSWKAVLIIARYRLRFFQSTHRLAFSLLFGLLLSIAGSIQNVPADTHGMVAVAEGFLANGLSQVGFLLAAVPACTLAGSGAEWLRGREGFVTRTHPQSATIWLAGMWLAAAAVGLLTVALYGILVAGIGWARLGIFPVVPWAEAVGVVMLITLAATSLAGALSLLFRETLWGVASSLILLLGILNVYTGIFSLLHQSFPAIPESLAWNLATVAPVMLEPLTPSPFFPLLGGTQPTFTVGLLVIIAWWVGTWLVGWILCLRRD